MVTKAYENIIYEKKPPIAYITLNRPGKMNSLSPELRLELRDALRVAGWEDNEIRVIVLKGAGRCFCAGFDLAEAREFNAANTIYKDAVQWRTFFRRGAGIDSLFWDLIWGNPKPIIAQVHSFCVAGGCALASFCDLCICSEDALFGYPNIRTGGPFIGAIWPWILGIRKAKELLFTGNLMDAQEAWRLRLVNKVVPGDRLEEEVNKLAQTIAKVPMVSNKYSKKVVNMAYELMNIYQVTERCTELEAFCTSASEESMPERAEYMRINLDKGLTSALEWRSARFTEEDAWFKEQKK